MHGFLPHIQRDDGAALRHAATDHGPAADLESVALLEHLAACFAGACLKHGPTPGWPTGRIALIGVHQEQADVVQVEPAAGQVHDLLDQLGRRQDAGSGMRDFGRGLKLEPAARHLLQQPGAVQGAREADVQRLVYVSFPRAGLEEHESQLLLSEEEGQDDHTVLSILGQ